MITSDHIIYDVQLSRYFPEYTGGPDVNKAAKYILWKFMLSNRAKLNVYPQFVSFHLLPVSLLGIGVLLMHLYSLTHVTDTSNTRLVLGGEEERIVHGGNNSRCALMRKRNKTLIVGNHGPRAGLPL